MAVDVTQWLRDVLALKDDSEEALYVAGTQAKGLQKRDGGINRVLRCLEDIKSSLGKPSKILPSVVLR